MMILVTGATGNVGSEAVRLLAARDQPVRALVRDPARSPVGGSVQVALGDFDRPETLDAAMRGVDTVIMVSPAVPSQEIAVIDSAVRAGVGHVVKITSKASPDSPVDRRRGQAEIEAHLESTGLPATLLRANAYLQNLLALAPMIKQTQGFSMSAGDGRVGMIDARDVAAVAARVSLAPQDHRGATHWLSGPELIGYADLADQLSALLGRPIEYRRLSPEVHRELMMRAGLPDPVATSNSQAFRLIGEGDAAWLSDDVETITGTPPRSMDHYLREHLESFGPA